MEAFSVDKFAANPTVEELMTLRKSDLLLVVDHFNVSAVKSTMRKSEILRQILCWFVDEEMFPPHALSTITTNSDETPAMEVRLRELEIEKARIELERERVALERTHAQIAQAHRGREGGDFDVTKHVRLVPDFDESDVDRSFLHFEQVAENMGWPKNKWASLLQTKLKGKACDAYATLSVNEAKDYDTVKKAIMQAYSLVPEAYRQKFRNMRKQESQSYREFAKAKQISFDRWLQSIEATEVEEVKQAILLEEFKRSVPADLRVYLDEKKCSKLMDTATTADEYSLARGVNRYVGQGRPYQNSKPHANNHNKQLDSKPSQGGNSSESETKNQNTKWNQCYYCKEVGHIRSNCPKLQEKKRVEKDTETKAFPNGLVGNPMVSKHITVPRVMRSADTDQIKSQYQPFMSVGYVSLVGSDDAKKVNILRDTGASKSLIVAHMLPFDGKSATGTSVVLQGVEGGFAEVPLHSVDLHCNLVSGTVDLGVISQSLPMEGVGLILGNDLAGEKVNAPTVSDVPLPKEQDKIAAPVAEVQRCAVTRSKVKKEESKKESEVHVDVDLGDSFFGRLVDSEPVLNIGESVKEVRNNDTAESVTLNKSRLLVGQQDRTIKADEGIVLMPVV